MIASATGNRAGQRRGNQSLPHQRPRDQPAQDILSPASVHPPASLCPCRPPRRRRTLSRSVGERVQRYTTWQRYYAHFATRRRQGHEGRDSLQGVTSCGAALASAQIARSFSAGPLPFPSLPLFSSHLQVHSPVPSTPGLPPPSRVLEISSRSEPIPSRPSPPRPRLPPKRSCRW